MGLQFTTFIIPSNIIKLIKLEIGTYIPNTKINKL